MKLTIRVPQPCHEDWNAMHARQAGRFCDSCQHTVADLTRATDAELLVLFTSDAKPKCARFDPRQLDRVLGNEAPRTSHALPIAAFTTLAAVASGCESISPDGASMGEPTAVQSSMVPRATTGIPMMVPMVDSATTCHMITGDSIAAVQVEDVFPVAGQATIEMITVVGDVEVLPEAPVEMTEFCGAVVDDHTGEPLPFTPIIVGDHPARTATDERGEFRLALPTRMAKDLVVLRIVLPGYEPLTKEVWGEEAQGSSGADDSSDVPISGPITGEASVINGFVTEVPRGGLLPGTIVRIKETGLAIRCDERGYFGLRVPDELAGRDITLEFDHPEAGIMSLPVLTDQLPLELPVKFTGQPAEPTARPDGCRDLGSLRMRQPYSTESFILGGVGLRYYKPTMWQRLSAPFRSRR